MNRITEFVIEYHFLFNRFSHHDSVIFSKPDNIYKFFSSPYVYVYVYVNVARVHVCFFFHYSLSVSLLGDVEKYHGILKD